MASAALFHTLVRLPVLKARRTLSQAFDGYLGVSTTDEDVADRLGIDHDVFRRTLRAFGWTSCWRLLRRLPSGHTQVFLDMGCGSGRMICAAARRHYQKVIGIEQSPELAKLARENIARLRNP